MMALMLLATGCGYAFPGADLPLPAGATAIRVGTFQNRTNEPGLESAARQAFADELARHGKLAHGGDPTASVLTLEGTLRQLDTLPIDELKVDRQFVAGIAGGRDSGAVVRAVVSVGHELGMTVVAEGVEDRATIARLGALGCDVAQGYEIARPAPVDEFEAWWRERNGEDRDTDRDGTTGRELSSPA